MSPWLNNNLHIKFSETGQMTSAKEWENEIDLEAKQFSGLTKY